MVASAGMAVAFQAIVNSQLGKSVGPLEASFISFGVGTIIGAILVFAGVGHGQLGAAANAPWYLFIGGALGLTYVFSITRSAPTIGIAAVMAAGIAGQLIAGVIFDHFGVLGTPRIPFDIWRGVGIVLLLAGVRLILR